MQEHDELEDEDAVQIIKENIGISYGGTKPVFSAKLQGAMGILSTRFVRKGLNSTFDCLI